ncbi:hypothetical protein [Marininema halotolerans]|uniref:hypothetical protein n=1 Tax=Marininema halotolerans TaxID=1155944 RepID=UPI001124CEB0|nr:hypothetical protein [Marininema halotolerans]
MLKPGQWTQRRAHLGAVRRKVGNPLVERYRMIAVTDQGISKLEYLPSLFAARRQRYWVVPRTLRPNQL